MQAFQLGLLKSLRFGRNGCDRMLSTAFGLKLLVQDFHYSMVLLFKIKNVSMINIECQ